MSKTERNHPASQWGTDIQFLKWVSTQPSVLDEDFNQYNPDRNIACHFRKLKFGAGRGIKPPFCAIPMTDAQHKLTDRPNGFVLALKKYAKLTLTPEEADKWFENAKDETLAKWIQYQQTKRLIS